MKNKEKKLDKEKEEKCSCEGDKENCDCNQHDCDCGCHDDEPNKEEMLKFYEQAFKGFEDALNKAEENIKAEKKRADENEHIARCFRQDLERFKERNKNIESELKTSVNKETALKIIPVLDNFDQALNSVSDENIKKGFEMIKNKLLSVLTDFGVCEIETDGEFNPEFHDCVSKLEAPNKKQKGSIARVFQKGYKFNDGKVIKHAVVEIYE